MYALLLVIMTTMANETVKQISLNQLVEDAIVAYDYKIYRLQVQNQEKIYNRTLIVQLLPQIGNPKVVVDCDIQPKLLDYYEWQTESWFMQQLSISYQERQAINCTDNTFYIGVSSEIVSGYQLVVYIQEGIQQLEYNIPLSGELIEHEILQFILNPIQSTESITIQITANQAEKYLKQCRTQDCSITIKDFEGNDTDTSLHIQQSSFSFIHQNCQDCFYLIGLQSNTKTQFRILARRKEQHIVLREGEQEQFHVEEGFYNYYLYNILNDTNVKSVKFQMTQYNGTCIMFGDSLNKYPDAQNHNMNSSSQLKASNSTYFYLSVYGQTECQYGIYTLVERYQTINQTYFIPLQSGRPQKYLSGNQYSFFQIKMIHRQNITITLQNIQGNFIMYVKSNLKNKEIPDSNSYEWKDSKHIEITTDHPNYTLLYYIGVQNLNDHGEFIIQYSMHGDIEFYQVGSQIIGTVAEKKFRYYKLPMQPRNLTITKDVYSDNDVFDLDVFISFDQKYTHPNIKNYNKHLITKNITIPDSELQCPQNSTKINEKNVCYIYLSVSSKSGTIFYTISTAYNNSRIQLHEGYPQTLTFNQETLFYYILNQKEVSVQWYSYGGSQAQVEAYFGDQDYPNLKYETFQPHSYFTQFQSITIPESKQYQILYIHVQPFTPFYQNDTYTIGIYEEVKLLTVSDPIIDIIQKGQIKYYKVSLTENIKSIEVSIHVKGGGDLITAQISKGRDERPTLHESNLKWTNVIGSSYILQEENDRYLTKDDYIIGVFGQLDCEFQISYNLDDVKFFNAFIGYPIDVIFPDNVPHYYIFRDNPIDKQFRIIIFALQGKLQIRAKLLDANQDDISFKQNDVLFLNEIIEKQKSFQVGTCNLVNCVYLIEITAVSGDCKGLIEFSSQHYSTTLYDQLQWREILNEQQISQYHFNSYFNVSINIEMISGDIQLYIKEDDEIKHNDEADLTQRVNNDTQIFFQKKNSSTPLLTIKAESLAPVSVFKISAIRQFKRIYTIHLGQMMTFNVRSLETINFQYQSITQNTNNQPKFITLQIQNMHQSIENLYFDISHNTIKPISYFNKYPKAISYHLYDSFGLYEISIKALYNSSLVKIIISNGELNALIDNVAQYQLAQIGQPNYYEIFLQQKSKLFLEVFTCSGSVLVQGTNNQTNLAKQIFEIQVMNSSKEHLQSILSLEAGTYYFLVKLISSHIQDNNNNKISSYFIKQQTFHYAEVIPQTSFETSNISIDWHKSDDNLIIHIPNLIQVKKDIALIHIYFIVRMQQAIGEKNLACMFESNYVNNKTNVYGKFTQVVDQNNQSNTTTVIFITKDQQTKYLSVVGKVEIQIENEIQELTYPLPILEMNYTNNLQEQTFHWILLGVFLTILFITGLFIYLNIKKQVNHQSQNTLNIEMNYQTFNN